MDTHAQAYREEAAELLAELETSLLDLESNPDDADLIGRVFRAMHTIKGSGAMFGFDDVASFTHEVETLYDRVREGGCRVTREVVDLSLAACDHIRKLIEGEGADPEKTETLTAAFRALAPAGCAGCARETVAEAGEGPVPAAKDVTVTWRVRFRPFAGMLSNGTNPMLLVDELMSLGTGRAIWRTDRVPLLPDFDPEACYLHWDAVLTTDLGLNAIRDVFIFVEDECELVIEPVEEAGGIDGEGIGRRLGEILMDRGDIGREELRQALAGQQRLGRILVDSETVEAEAVEAALAEQRHMNALRRARDEQAQATSIRVAADKLDRLVDLVGELVTVQASLSQQAGNSGETALLSIAEDVERLTSELRDNTMSIRMTPFGTTFGRFKRLVRDLAGDLGKEVRLTTEGGETELDKTVIQQLSDPLVHIIRNSVDHGIESPEAREAAGKPRQGAIHLSAAHAGANVLIRVTDDGAGLDAERIRRKAVDRGLVSPDAELSDEQALALIFAPGLSTAETVTGVSGRGVGMDVVKRNIEALRGTIEVHSRPGEGTTVSLKMPLTLAIIDGLLVAIDENFFVLPLHTVEECIELRREGGGDARGWDLARVRDDLVPYVPLRRLFDIAGDPPAIEQAVITRWEGTPIGFVVDQIIGEHQTVIKNLGKVYRNAKGVSGATILADGTVALILDVNGLAEIGKAEEMRN